MMEYDVSKYYVPLKQPFRTLPYDIAAHCDALLTAYQFTFPPYLRDLSDRMHTYASQVEQVKPKRFPKGYRLYVIDQRLRTSLILHDANGGKVTQFCYEFARYQRPLDEYIFGDGEKLEKAFRYDLFAMKYDSVLVDQFISSYGFIPFDEFAMPMLLVFDGPKLDDRRILSSWQALMLLEKYREQNLVDLRKHLEGIFDPYTS